MQPGGSAPAKGARMKSLPSAYLAPIAVPAAFSRDVDAASFRRLRRRQYRRLRRILIDEGEKISDCGLALVRHALFAYYVDGRDVALEEASP